MKKRVIVVISVLAIAGVFFAWYILGDKDDGSIRTSGIVEGAEVNLASKISGRISEICCSEGGSIQAGQVAARLESSDLKASVDQAAAGVERARADVMAAAAAVENAEANILNSEAEIKGAEADLENARVRREEAKRDMQRAEELCKKDFIAKASLDQAVSQYDSSVAAEKAAAAKLKAAAARKNAAAAQRAASAGQLNASNAMLKETEAALAFSRFRLDDATIHSPASGTVIFKALEKGENVSPGGVILTIVDLAGLYVRADIEETLVGFVAPGSDAFVTVESLHGKVFRGKVSEIGRYAEFATQRDVTRGRQDIKTFRVKIRIGDTGGILKPGMTVSVGIPKKK